MRRAVSCIAVALGWAATAQLAADELVLEDFRVQAGPDIVVPVQSVRTPACDPGRAPLLLIEDAEPAQPLATALAEAGYPVYRLADRGPAPAAIAADIAALASWIRARHPVAVPDPAPEPQEAPLR